MINIFYNKYYIMLLIKKYIENKKNSKKIQKKSKNYNLPISFKSWATSLSSTQELYFSL